MAHTETGKPVKGPCGKAAPFLAWRFIAAFAVIMSAAGPENARGQDTLRWKFRNGEVLKYTTEQTTVMTVKLMGNEKKEKTEASCDHDLHLVGQGGVRDR